MAFGKKRDFLFKKRAKIRLLGPWTHQTHLTLEHIKKLGEFIEAILSHDAPYPRNPAVAICRPSWTILIRILTHRSAFQTELHAVPHASAEKKSAFHFPARLLPQLGPSSATSEGFRSRHPRYRRRASGTSRSATF